ncbi:hypothetical protein MMC07_000341 [Pseudocyphellaria aurata]|nr:hypothetical protein [Pseudocyphellaria aurata]
MSTGGGGGTWLADADPQAGQQDGTRGRQRELYSRAGAGKTSEVAREKRALRDDTFEDIAR